ncbi:MAG: hypothetical protein PUC30_09895 [Lachnospiraceae bacterium]|nr:hypothetical protein [Lachnospiraceae bacterium]
MNNGLKALLIAASTIITCIIVGLGFQMAREAKQIGNYVVEELHQYRTAAEERDYMKYDAVTVYGNDVVNLMKQEFSGEKSGLRITVKEGNTGYSYENSEDVKRAQDAETEEYIVPTSEYTGEVVRNENEVIVELIFQKNR